MSCRCHTLTAVTGSEAAALWGLNAARRMMTERGILLMEKLGQLLRTTWKRLLTLRMVAWSPVLVAAIIVWWVVKWWFSRRRARSDERTVRGTGGATRGSLQSGGR